MKPKKEQIIATQKAAPTGGPVTVFDYLDYRAYLRDLYHTRKAQDSKFSCRYIAQKVGFRSASYFTQVLSGRSAMTSEMALRFAAFLRLDPREAEYLELLVLHQRAKSLKERRQYLERLGTFREALAVRVPPEHFEFYSQWHHTAIRELLFLEPFTGDHAALGRRLRPAISPAKAKASIELLLKLGMAKKENDLVVRAHAQSTTTGEAVKSVEVDGFHDSTLQLARDSIDGLPREERSLSSLTVTLSKAGRARVESEIVEFRRRVLAIAQADACEIGVYHLGIQLFPMTREATP
jgi:uncharacterized protein (TIGR02147 family)